MSWGGFGNNGHDGFNAKSYEYKPTWEKDVERHPDRLPSASRLDIVDRGTDIVMVLEIKAENGAPLGAFGVRTVADPPTGRLLPAKAFLFTTDEIRS